MRRQLDGVIAGLPTASEKIRAAPAILIAFPITIIATRQILITAGRCTAGAGRSVMAIGLGPMAIGRPTPGPATPAAGQCGGYPVIDLFIIAIADGLFGPAVVIAASFLPWMPVLLTFTRLTLIALTGPAAGVSTRGRGVMILRIAPLEIIAMAILGAITFGHAVTLNASCLDLFELFQMDPEIVLGMLEIAFGLHTITGRTGIAREGQIFLVDLHRAAADPDIRPVGIKVVMPGGWAAATSLTA